MPLIFHARANPLAAIAFAMAVVVSPVGLSPLAARQAAADDRVTLLDGSGKTGNVTSLSEDEKLSASAFNDPIELQTVRRIERLSAKPRAAVGDTMIFLSNGGVVLGGNVLTDGQKITFDWAFGKVALPIDAVRAVRKKVDPKLDAKAKALLERGVAGFDRQRAGNSDKDRLYVSLKDGVQAVSGVIHAITNEEVSFEFGGQKRSVKAAKVFGYVLVGGDKPNHLGQVMVTMSDGSTMWGSTVSLKDGKLTLRLGEHGDQPTAGARLALPWSQVQRVDVRSNRLVYLSDLEPLRVRQQASLTFAWPWKRDTSVMGRPLTLAKKTYEKGLGVHASNTLVFEVPGDFGVFSATIGIDDETKGKGDCVFRVLVDGEERFRRRMTGKSPAAEVRVSIVDARQVTLEVEQGADWDLADHANWCSARFVRE